MIYSLLALFIAPAFAAPAAPADFVRVNAITQFVDGNVQKTETSGVKSGLVFQTPLYEGDRVETAAGSALKVATRNGCIFVLRGEGTLAAPIVGKPWRLRASSLRVLCRGHAENETFGVANSPLLLKDGEVLFLNKQVLLINGSASYMGTALVPRRLYVIEGTSLKDALPQPNANELRSLNLGERPPREGYEWPVVESVKPEKLYTSRLMFGPVGGGDGVTYDNTDYEQGGLRGGGARLQMHFRRSNETSFIVALTARDSEKNSEENSNQPTVGVRNSLDSKTLEFGLRQKHDRWWSPFVRAGVGVVKSKISYLPPSGSAGFSGSTTYNYEFYVVNATWGLDAHLTPRFVRPFGVFASAEATVYQSFHRGARANEQSGNFPSQYIPDEAWRLTGFDVLFNAGLELEF